MATVNGISIAGVDNVLAAFSEYQSDIESFLNQISETQDYAQAYKGLDHAVKGFVDQTCEAVKVGIIDRISATTEALNTAKLDYMNMIEEEQAEITKDSSKFEFTGKTR